MRWASCGDAPADTKLCVKVCGTDCQVSEHTADGTMSLHHSNEAGQRFISSSATKPARRVASPRHDNRGRQLFQLTGALECGAM